MTAETGARAFADRIEFVILGEPASKANSRKIVTFGKRAASIKSDKARSFEHSALQQIPVWARRRLEGPVRVSLRIFYATERPDLDESLVLDILQDRFAKVDKKTRIAGAVAEKLPRMRIQDGVYRNDRQVREKHVFHGIDRKNPRVEIVIEPLTAQNPRSQKIGAGQ